MTISPEPLLAHHRRAVGGRSLEFAAGAHGDAPVSRLDAARANGARSTPWSPAGEAIANAIEHAYDRRPNQTFVVRARYENQRCTILMEDTGTWHDGPPAATRAVAASR